MLKNILSMPNPYNRPSRLLNKLFIHPGPGFVIPVFLLLAALLSAAEDFASANLSAYQPEEEVFLSFRYRGGVNTVVIAYKKGETYYLPVTELFGLLAINYKINPVNMSISGFYIEKKRQYRLGFQDRIALIGERELNFTASDFLIKETDIYMTPLIFKAIFNLDFSVDFNRLV